MLCLRHRGAATPAGGGSVAAVGEIPATASEIVVRFGGGNKPIADRRYSVTAAPIRFEGAGALWAADQVTQFAAAERWKDLRTVSRRFNVASPHMSFVVLENAQDYVTSNITPPSSFPRQWRDEYKELKAAADEERCVSWQAKQRSASNAAPQQQMEAGASASS